MLCYISLSGRLQRITTKHRFLLQWPCSDQNHHSANQLITNMDNKAAARQPSIATERNANVLYSGGASPATEGSWLERKLRPSKVSARYPIKGKALLFATCGFGSLGDALFGYNSGEWMSVHHELQKHNG